MSSEPDSTDFSLPWPALDRIDRVCLEFEAAWKAGERPRIEDYLGEAQGAERAQLLRELLLLDLDYRRREAEQPTLDEYQARFPQDGKRVDDAFQQFSIRTASSPPAGTRVRYFGDYELLEEIGHGGMGVIYKARQISLNRTVAVKMILKGHLATEAEVQRFHREAETAANLQHPNIVTIHEVGVHDGQHYFSMDYVEGRSLAEMVRENPLPARRAAEYVRVIAEAVHYAHEQGTLHRDLKPSNVLIDRADQPRITDFGLAKRIEADLQLTTTGQILGTASYMAPEQASGRHGELSPASDVHALGATLYELITGRPPFRAATLLDTLLLVRETEPVSPRLLNPKVPHDLETIILKCLEKDPRRRYQTAGEVAEELHRVLKGEPIQACPVGAVGRYWRFLRRDPGGAMVPLFLMGSLVTVLLSLLIYRGLLLRERGLIDAEFKIDAGARIRSIEQRFQRNVEVIYSLTAFYAASREVERDGFREFTKPVLSRCEEIKALEWVPRVAATSEAGVEAERAGHEESVRREGNRHRDYQITERSREGFIAAPERDEYFPVCFVEPYDSNRAVAGFNLASEPERGEAFERLLKTGELVAVSGSVPPLFEEDAGPAVLVVGPIYRKGVALDTRDQRRENLVGFVINEVWVDLLLEQALGNSATADIGIEMFDEFALPAPRLLCAYPSKRGRDPALPSAESEAPAPGEAYYKDVFKLPGRNWSIHCRPTEAYTTLRKPSPAPLVSLLIGLLLAAILFVSGLLLKARPR